MSYTVRSSGTIQTAEINGLPGADVPGSAQFDPDQVLAVLDAVDAARPHLRFITASIRRALPTSSPDDIKGQLAGLEARLVGGRHGG